jgi:hypothetical protein
MLADPFTIAANSPTPSLVMSRIKSDGYGAEYVNATGDYRIVVQHTPGKNQNRHYVKLTQTVTAANPYTGVNQEKAASVSFSISVPDFGFTPTAMVALCQALLDSMLDSEVTFARLLQGQS